MDNLDKDIRMAEKLGYGVHYGAFKADYPNTREKTPEQIDPELQPCLWCGMLFRKDQGRRKLFATMLAAGCTMLKKSMRKPTKGGLEMEDPCETCLRW